MHRPGVELEAQLEVARENVAWAAERARAQDASIMIEAVNSQENGPYLLDTTAKAIGFLDAVGADNVALQYDVYHMQRMEGNLAETITRLLPRIGHVQIADPPGRGEPGTGEVNYGFVLGLLERSRVRCWVGLEYNPTTPTTEESFGWMKGAWLCLKHDRLHRPGDHGRTDGCEPAARRLSAGRPQPRRRAKVEEFVSEEARTRGRSDSPKEVAERTEVVITMLPDSPDVEQVYLGEDGVIAGARTGQLLIDMSSIAPAVAKAVSEAASAVGAAASTRRSGAATSGAREGTLSIMVGGPEDAFERALPLFEVLGKTIVRLGEAGRVRRPRPATRSWSRSRSRRSARRWCSRRRPASTPRS